MNTTHANSLVLIESVVHDVLSGDVDLLTACRTVVQHRHSAGLRSSEAIDVIVAVESELDDLPAASEEDMWSIPAYFHAKQVRDAYLAIVREELLRAFAELSAQLQLCAKQ